MISAVVLILLLVHVEFCYGGSMGFERSCSDLGQEKFNFLVNAMLQAQSIAKVAAKDLEKQRVWAEIMHDSVLPEDNYKRTIDYFWDVAELGTSSSPLVIHHQCDIHEEHLEDTNGRWSDATWRNKDDQEVLDDDGQPIKMLSTQDFDQDDRPQKPCEIPGRVAYIERGHGRFEHVAHVQICQLFWDDKRLDERGADVINQQGILPTPFGNTLDYMYPRELHLFHEYMHIIGGLNETETSRRADDRLGISLILDDTYNFRGCEGWIRAGRDTRYVADCYRVAAQGIYLQIEVDRFGHENEVPTAWWKGIIDRETMTGPTSREDRARLWASEEAAAQSYHHPTRLSPIIEEEEEDEENKEQGESCDAESSDDESVQSESESEEERPDSRKRARPPLARLDTANRRGRVPRAGRARLS